MATTVSVRDQLQGVTDVEVVVIDRPAGSPWLRLGVRARQIALITLLVALVVVVTTAVNIANLTAVIISRTVREASQVSDQFDYAVRQELAHNSAVDHLDDNTALASEHSGVRGLLESTLVTSHTIAYLYLTNADGQIITDSDGRHELTANRYLIGDVPTGRPNLNQLADQGGYVQLARVLLGPPIYEYQKRLESEGSLVAELHIGVSASAVWRELLSPVATNLFIGLLAIVGAAIIAIGSANL